ncbi:MAG TPA: phytoene/squalene synthase family protein [Thermoanaerobaculia bacterium]|nr:phytoene/squalene synthase family protein [Thermoanaerobaculia bacterium]
MTIDDAYAECRAIAHKHGANFSVGFRFLPREKRRAVYAAYAYCRVADDIADDEATVILSREDGEGPVDSGAACDATGPSPSARLRMTRSRLDAWQRELDACYAQNPNHAITIALADALTHFDIPKSAFVALIDGCRQDMTKSRYETFDELLHYCDLVATSISDISLSIFGYRHDRAREYGRNLATALQLTNVTRDVGDDLGRDRIYLPREELRRFEVSEEELIARKETDRMRALIAFQIDRAERYFNDAEPLLGELEFDARFGVLLMGGIYATVLRKLRKDPLVVIRKRLSLTKLQKVMVVGTRMLRPHFV